MISCFAFEKRILRTKSQKQKINSSDFEQKKAFKKQSTFLGSSRTYLVLLGWYDRKNIGEFRTIIDVNFAMAMGPPEGGRNPVTARLLRHFHYLTFTEMEDKSQVYLKYKLALLLIRLT